MTLNTESNTYSENSMCKILGTRGWKDGYFFQIVKFSHSLRIWEEYTGSIMHRAGHRRREMHFSGGSYVHLQMRTSILLRKQNEQVTFYYLCRWTKIPAHYPWVFPPQLPAFFVKSLSLGMLGIQPYLFNIGLMGATQALASCLICKSLGHSVGRRFCLLPHF